MSDPAAERAADWARRTAVVKAGLAPALAMVGTWRGRGQAHGEPVTATLTVRAVLDATQVEVWERVEARAVDGPGAERAGAVERAEAGDGPGAEPAGAVERAEAGDGPGAEPAGAGDGQGAERAGAGDGQGAERAGAGDGPGADQAGAGDGPGAERAGAGDGPGAEPVDAHEDVCFYRYDVGTAQIRVLHLMAPAMVAEYAVEASPDGIVWVTPPNTPAVVWSLRGGALISEVYWPDQRVPEVRIVYERG